MHLQKHYGIGHVSVRVGGIQLNGLLKMEGGLPPITFTGQQATKVSPGFGIVWIGTQRRAEGYLSTLLVSHLRQACPQIVLRVGEIWLELKCFPKMIYCLFPLSHSQFNQRLLVPQERIGRFPFDGFLQNRQCLVFLPSATESCSKASLSARRKRIEGQRLSIGVYRS